MQCEHEECTALATTSFEEVDWSWGPCITTEVHVCEHHSHPQHRA